MPINVVAADAADIVIIIVERVEFVQCGCRSGDFLLKDNAALLTDPFRGNVTIFVSALQLRYSFRNTFTDKKERLIAPVNK